jgi:hypothetical protein
LPQGKYRGSENFIDDIVDEAGIRTGRDPKNPEFRELVFSVLKKYCEENIPL